MTGCLLVSLLHTWTVTRYLLTYLTGFAIVITCVILLISRWLTIGVKQSPRLYTVAPPVLPEVYTAVATTNIKVCSHNLRRTPDPSFVLTKCEPGSWNNCGAMLCTSNGAVSRLHKPIHSNIYRSGSHTCLSSSASMGYHDILSASCRARFVAPIYS